MNGYQRIKLAMAGIMPDCRPVMLHNFMFAARNAGYTMKQYREDPEIAAKCHIQFVEKFGVDGILFDVDTALLAGAVGVEVDYPDDEPARTHIPLIHSLDEVDSLADIDIEKNERIQHSLESIRLLKSYFRDEIFIRGNCDQAPFSLACSIRTPAMFMMDLIIDELRAIKLLNYTTKICKQYIRLMCKTGADMVSNGDSPAGPSMISPKMYSKFAKPFEKMVVHEAHKMNLPYLLHICGDTDLILEQMCELNLDAVELDYNTPISRIYDIFSNKTTLFGTIDPSGIIALGTPAKVVAEVNKLLDLYEGNARLVIGAGCAIPPTAPEENIRAFINTVKKNI